MEHLTKEKYAEIASHLRFFANYYDYMSGKRKGPVVRPNGKNIVPSIRQENVGNRARTSLAYAAKEWPVK